MSSGQEIIPRFSVTEGMRRLVRLLGSLAVLLGARPPDTVNGAIVGEPIQEESEADVDEQIVGDPPDLRTHCWRCWGGKVDQRDELGLCSPCRTALQDPTVGPLERPDEELVWEHTITPSRAYQFTAFRPGSNLVIAGTRAEAEGWAREAGVPRRWLVRVCDPRPLRSARRGTLVHVVGTTTPRTARLERAAIALGLRVVKYFTAEDVAIAFGLRVGDFTHEEVEHRWPGSG